MLCAQASLLHQSQQFQFVDIGDTVQISCTSKEGVQHGGIFFSWYKRQEGAILWVKDCFFNQTPGKFVCRAQGKDLILEIAQVQKEDTGIYFCAEHLYINFSFGAGTSLIVGGKEGGRSFGVGQNRCWRLRPGDQITQKEDKDQIICKFDRQ